MRSIVLNQSTGRRHGGCAILAGMLSHVTTTHRPARDLGFPPHPHPDRAHRFDVAAGTAHVLYPEAADDRATATLLLEVDPVALVREGGGTLGQYVDDRPYATSSLLAVALDTRAELAAWAEDVCATHCHTVRHLPVGPVAPEVGAPTRLVVFSRVAA
jgi:Hen1-like subunit of RNA repair complex